MSNQSKTWFLWLRLFALVQVLEGLARLVFGNLIPAWELRLMSRQLDRETRKK